MKMIGAADEFWRLRLTRVDTTEDLDLEWRSDILYRQPVAEAAEEIEQWIVEAIRIEDYETIVQVAVFADRDDAEAFFRQAEDDLHDMTKAGFEEAYLTPPSESDDEVAL